ncbi:uncharacterized protein [Chiloscyllium punctatum]|uniref:uncharacterized protein n=1 Tax=Chiloscyllium punctatum TaxID=137246 RepID=UPI003B632C9D
MRLTCASYGSLYPACCGLAAADVYCLQDFPEAGYFDVTFRSVKQCEQLLKVFKEKEGEPLFSILSATPLCVLPAQRNRVVTIHMYNPYVPAADVLTFLGRYVQVEGEAKRQVRVTLRADDSGNILHPPSSFAIGGSRGYLTYAGQPKVCRTCGKSGHVAVDCKVTICRNCKQEGRLTKDCREEKSCNLCGEAGHMYKAFTRRGAATYAQMAGGGNTSRGPTKSNEVPRISKGTVSGGTQKEGKVVEEQAADSGEMQQLTQAPARQTEEMEEEGSKEAEQWIIVKNRKRKPLKGPKATKRKGKRHLKDEDTGSSSEGEDGRKKGRHQRKRQSAVGRKEGSTAQEGKDDPSEGMGEGLPLPGENQRVPTGPQLQVTGSSVPVTALLSDGERGDEDPGSDTMTPGRGNDSSVEPDNYLSPGKVQQFAVTTGMHAATPLEQDQKKMDTGNPVNG